MGRREEVLVFLKTSHSEKGDSGITTKEVARHLSLSRTAASRELNHLVREGLLEKKQGKPVEFFICTSLKKEQRQIKTQWNEKATTFSNFIGSKGSMEVQTNLAKAAIMYPPSGLHTIILGSTGVGKSTFAKIMYEYGKEIGRFKKESPFLHFNCSDYSNNPQLLLAILFGYVKGSFTGADTDKVGMIAKANKGILFLDEVHRLPPEGQEMLFTIMDTHKYRRLGETDSEAHESNVLIICATTENTDSVLLQTFKRRFPVVLTLPDLKVRTLMERLQLIDYFFQLESKKIEREIFVESQVIAYLASYNCPGNIGQLKNDIQIFCAKEFAFATINGEEKLRVRATDSEIRQFLEEHQEVTKNTLFTDCIYYEGNKEHPQKSTTVRYPAAQKESNFYQKILEKYSTLLREGRSMKEIQQKITYFLDTFFKVNLKPELVEVPQNKGIEKLVSKEILEIVEQAIQKIATELSLTCDSHVMYNLALHIEALVLKLQANTTPYLTKKIVETSSKTIFRPYTEHLIAEVNQQMDVQIPDEERDIIELFLDTIYRDVQKNPIGILILMHGKGVATNLASMVNTLLGIHHAVGIDMALDDSVLNVYQKVIEMVKKINNGSGVLLLVDMGSLTSFSDEISKDTGIETRSIDNVTSPIIIEATRKALFANTTLAKLVKEILEEKNYYVRLKKQTNIFDYSSRRLIKNKDHLFYQSLEKSVTFLNVDQATVALDEMLIALSKRLRFEIIDTLVIKFYFHCLGLLERALRKEGLQFRVKDEEKDEVYEIVAEEIKLLERMYGTQISEGEIVYVAKIIQTFL